MKQLKNRTLWILWILLYILTAGLGFIPDPPVWAMLLLMLIGLSFFLPPAILLYRSIQAEDKKTLALLRLLCLISLGATLVLLVLNVLSVLMSEAMGIFLNTVLGLVSAPMMCVQFRGIGMFLWACLLMSSLMLKKR